LIGLGEYVTWKAKHFGVYQKLTSKITQFKSPYYFVDEMVNGAFKAFKHEHHFEECKGVTLLTDYFVYTSTFGAIGKLADRLFLENYMTELLKEKNQTIKKIAETEQWKVILNK